MVNPAVRLDILTFAARKSVAGNDRLHQSALPDTPGELSFDQLLTRLTQSAARAKKLAAEHPAVMFVFDMLADDCGLLL